MTQFASMESTRLSCFQAAKLFIFKSLSFPGTLNDFSPTHKSSHVENYSAFSLGIKGG